MQQMSDDFCPRFSQILAVVTEDADPVLCCAVHMSEQTELSLAGVDKEFYCTKQLIAEQVC